MVVFFLLLPFDSKRIKATSRLSSNSGLFGRTVKSSLTKIKVFKSQPAHLKFEHLSLNSLFGNQLCMQYSELHILYHGCPHCFQQRNVIGALIPFFFSYKTYLKFQTSKLLIFLASLTCFHFWKINSKDKLEFLFFFFLRCCKNKNPKAE